VSVEKSLNTYMRLKLPIKNNLPATPLETSLLSPSILLLRAAGEGGGKGLFSSLLSSLLSFMFFPVFFVLVYLISLLGSFVPPG
jgi:hypothetical protein